MTISPRDSSSYSISNSSSENIGKERTSVTLEFHPLAKIAKDVAAGGVLVSAMYAVVVGYILFYNKLNMLTGNIALRIRESELHITVICIVIVLIAVVVVKAVTLTGTPVRGGMPSGHAALAFALATSITLITERVEASFRLACSLVYGYLEYP